ncbi:hypothetical protein D3C86_1844090 [compost metagenome]
MLVHFVSGLHVHIDSHSQDHVTHICRITNQLEQYPRDFFLTYKDIVRPFQSSGCNTEFTQRLQDSEPNDETQALQLTHPTINA